MQNLGQLVKVTEQLVTHNNWRCCS